MISAFWYLYMHICLQSDISAQTAALYCTVIPAVLSWIVISAVWRVFSCTVISAVGQLYSPKLHISWQTAVLSCTVISDFRQLDSSTQWYKLIESSAVLHSHINRCWRQQHYHALSSQLIDSCTLLYSRIICLLHSHAHVNQLIRQLYYPAQS